MRKLILTAAAVLALSAPVYAEMSREIDSDLFNVAHLMMGEAGYTDSTETRLTASVLLNRVDSNKFPDTIGECLYQPGQYSTVRDGGPFWNEPTADCWKDAEELLTHWYATGDTDLPEDVLYQSLFPQGSGTYMISGWGQYFCYG
jgi:spore germination cell wall hydrolase CwlJ-like protein